MFWLEWQSRLLHMIHQALRSQLAMCPGMTGHGHALTGEASLRPLVKQCLLLQCHRFRVKKSMKIKDFKAQITEELQIPSRSQRLWLWTWRVNKSYRPVRAITPGTITTPSMHLTQKLLSEPVLRNPRSDQHDDMQDPSTWPFSPSCLTQVKNREQVNATQ